jgi:hypothetical protein
VVPQWPLVACPLLAQTRAFCGAVPVQPLHVFLCVQGNLFNEMRSKTKVLQKPVTNFDPK